jgi:hypothetical protein
LCWGGGEKIQKFLELELFKMKYLGTLMKNWILFVIGAGIATIC